MAVEGMDESIAPSRRRRPHHRLHLVRPDRHERLGYGFDQSARPYQQSRALHPRSPPAQSRSRIPKARAGVFFAADFQQQIPDPDRLIPEESPNVETRMTNQTRNSNDERAGLFRYWG